MATKKIAKDKLRLIIGLLLAVLIPLFFGKYIPLSIKLFSYNLSLSMKHMLLLVLPFVIFSFIFSCLLSFDSGVIKIVFLLILLIFLSNLTTIFFGYSVGRLSNHFFDLHSVAKINLDSVMTSTWALDFPLYIVNKHGLLLGFIFGLFYTYRKNKKATEIAAKLNNYSHIFLKKVFIPVLPLFIIGFVFKLQQDQLLVKALGSFGPIFFVVIGAQITWIFLNYFVYNKFDIKDTWRCIKNVFPATMTGFSTISSAASLPVLILCSEKNADPKIVDTVLPASINTHTLGSAVGVTVLSLTIIEMFNVPIDFMSFCVFAFYYALAKFSVAAVPGGVIVVVLPLLETYLGFSPGMLGLITAMYMLFDPFGTSVNVTGNGAFVIMFDKVCKKLENKKL